MGAKDTEVRHPLHAEARGGNAGAPLTALIGKGQPDQRGGDTPAERVVM